MSKDTFNNIMNILKEDYHSQNDKLYKGAVCFIINHLKQNGLYHIAPCNKYCF